MAELFGRGIKTIGKHITNALKEELKSIPVIAKFATTAADGKTYQVEYYKGKKVRRTSPCSSILALFTSSLSSWHYLGQTGNHAGSQAGLALKTFVFSLLSFVLTLLYFVLVILPHHKSYNIKQ